MEEYKKLYGVLLNMENAAIIKNAGQVNDLNFIFCKEYNKVMLEGQYGVGSLKDLFCQARDNLINVNSSLICPNKESRLEVLFLAKKGISKIFEVIN